ncbi:MAG: hypothetical protein HUU02_07425 [Bacteroidetes bacterium]|nr:hypothetical protein [Bacteroidota bacterium]
MDESMGCGVIILTISELGEIARMLILATAHYNIRKPNWQFPARRKNILKGRREVLQLEPIIFTIGDIPPWLFLLAGVHKSPGKLGLLCFMAVQLVPHKSMARPKDGG